jgi:hypothetical protein
MVKGRDERGKKKEERREGEGEGRGVEIRRRHVRILQGCSSWQYDKAKPKTFAVKTFAVKTFAAKCTNYTSVVDRRESRVRSK